MKKILSLMLIVGLPLAELKVVHATAASDMFLRSPVLTQQNVESDIRLRGLGGLYVSVEDESNAIGLFQYGGIAAGLPLDYPQHKAEFSYSYEAGEYDDKSAFADAFTGKQIESTQHSIGGFGAAHFGTGSLGEGSLLLSIQRDDNEGDYTRSFLTSAGFDSAKNEPRITHFVSGYGHRFNNLLMGLGYSDTDFDFADLTIRASGLSVPSRLTYETQNISPSVGYVFNISDDQRLITSLQPSFRDREIIVEGWDTTLAEANQEVLEMDGEQFGGGLIFNMKNSFKAALFADTGELDGDRRFRQGAVSDHGKAEQKETNYSLRLFYKAVGLPLSFGAELADSNTKLESRDSTTALLEDSKSETTNIVFGTAFHFPEEKGLIGAEYTLIDQKDRDAADPTVNNDGEGFQVSLGSEYNFWENLWARAGIRHRNVGDDLQGALPELDSKTLELNLGLESRFGENGRLSLLYTNTKIETDGFRGATAAESSDAQEFKSNRIQLVGTYRFGGDAAK